MDCDKCPEGVLEIVQSGCVPYVKNCVDQSKITGLCESCLAGLSLSNNTCLNRNCATNTNGICTECKTGYHLKENNICLDVNCAVYTGDICTQCALSAAKISTGQCIQLPSNCQSINDNRLCTSCANGYSLINGTCSLIPTMI